VHDIIEHIPIEPFELTLNGMGAFGDLWWIGLEPSGELQGYVRQLRHMMAEAVIPFDRKRFSPHITILRRASIDIMKVGMQPVGRAKMVVDHASLMRSDRGRSGMIYTEI
jgi:2'-5' RNA ligase